MRAASGRGEMAASGGGGQPRLMYNLLISIAVGIVLFVVTGLIGGNWLAGIIPALLGLGIVYFLLARRSGQQLQAIMERAMAEFQALEGHPQPRTQREANKLMALQKEKIAKGRAIMEEGFKLSRWQFLVDQQIHAQIGAIEYMQQNYDTAREHLEKAWSRHWQAQAMLACMDFRDKKIDEALTRMEGADGAGGSDALFWGIYAWIAYKERGWGARIGWLLAVLLTGNMAMAVYMLLQLRGLPANATAADVLLRRG